MNVNEMGDRAIAIIGFGIEGQSTYAYLRKRYPSCEIAIADRHPYSLSHIPAEVCSAIEHDRHLRTFFGSDYLKQITGYSVAIRTAGIPLSHPGLRAFQAAGGVVTSHIQIFFEVFDKNRIIGVTGTKGKSTTASLLYHIAHNGGLDVRLGGNIGQPPLSLLETVNDKTLFVLELSSYQLDEFPYSPHIAVLLDIVPEHIGLHEPSSEAAHHQDFKEYVAAKANITRSQDSHDILLFNPSREVPRAIATKSLARTVHFSPEARVDIGCYISGEQILYSDGSNEREIAAVSDIRLLGKSNRENVLAAMSAALLLHVDPSTIPASLRSYKSLPHRIEFIGEYKGIRFYDDSIATVPEATLNALDGLGNSVQTLIAGGHDRNLTYDKLGLELVQSDVKNLILFRPTGHQIWEAVLGVAQNPIRIKPFWPESMEEAVRIAFKITDPGKVCLLSPASSSYGMFKNFIQRAKIFRECVERFGREPTT
jgi:UDP-N-acetylmuramoylalanine--D-glutamate ligase